ncbi:hypothetical protein HanPI659440_Chr08g0290111 [Helianthus annuus]|nr:hypothetical protein HanPI659440_Chr08g0290111 [Helianthus annuus]
MDEYQADLPPDHLADHPLEYDPPTDHQLEYDPPTDRQREFVDLPWDHRVDFPDEPLNPPPPSYISGTTFARKHILRS